MAILKHTGLLLLAIVPGLVFWQWASQPLWQLTQLRCARYHCHDVQRQELVVFVSRGNEQFLETRHLWTGALLKQVSITEHTRGIDFRVYPNALPQADDQGLAVILLRRQPDKPSQMELLVVERGTGRCLSPLPISCDDFYCHTQSYGQQAAISTGREVMLFDSPGQEPRTLGISGVNALQIVPPGNLLVCSAGQGQVHVIEWKTGKLLATNTMVKIVEIMGKIGCTRDGDILLGGGGGGAQTYLDRYRWNGTTFDQTAGRAYFYSPFLNPGGIGGLVYSEDSQGRIHVTQSADETWPSPWRDVITWAQKTIGWQVGKHFSKQMLFHWTIVDHHNQVVGQFESPSWFIKHIGQHLCIHVWNDPSYSSQSLKVVRVHPAWPNALAVTVVVYLLLYVVRHRHRRV